MNHHVDNEKKLPARLSRTVGCMLGGAVGDSLGAPVEFLSLDQIRRRHGGFGTTQFEEAYGRKGAITDDNYHNSNRDSECIPRRLPRGRFN